MDFNDPKFQSMFQNLVKNAQSIKDNLSDAYKEMAEKNKEKTVQASAGGDYVIATVNYNLEVKGLEYKPELFKEDPEVVSELIISAINAGLSKAKEAVREEMSAMQKKMGLPDQFGMNMPGMG